MVFIPVVVAIIAGVLQAFAERITAKFLSRPNPVFTQRIVAALRYICLAFIIIFIITIVVNDTARATFLRMVTLGQYPKQKFDLLETSSIQRQESPLNFNEPAIITWQNIDIAQSEIIID